MNPAHLFLGTIPVNNQDMLAKGRTTFGTRHWKARLSEDDVREIRRLAVGHVSNGRWSTGTTYRAIASRFGITPTHVADIVQKKRWNYVA